MYHVGHIYCHSGFNDVHHSKIHRFKTFSDIGIHNIIFNIL
jgi:hypothetical protein